MKQNYLDIVVFQMKKYQTRVALCYRCVLTTNINNKLMDETIQITYIY